jgi:hypothetical protein
MGRAKPSRRTRRSPRTTENGGNNQTAGIEYVEQNVARNVYYNRRFYIVSDQSRGMRLIVGEEGGGGQG